ncbi:MAG: uncharacterized protein JWM12_1689 [Ilumatobacteraceae bacterium]|nr:uncharacterized protein [Ilumatobacteraceae bacterium]
MHGSTTGKAWCAMAVVAATLSACSSSTGPIVLDTAVASTVAATTPGVTTANTATSTSPTSVTASTAASADSAPASNGSADPAASAASTTSTASIAPASTATPTIDPNAVTTTLPPLTPQNAPLVQWNGRQQYMHGANLPWFNYGADFGGGPSGGGASSAAVRAGVGQALVTARATGMNVVRWWLFPGQPTQFVLDANGLPTAISANVYTDIDAAVELAKSSGISYVFTLFSGPTALPASWVATPAGRQQVATVLGTLFAHYRGNPQIMTWDVINEPEFDVWDGKANAQDVRDFIAAIATAVHANSDAPVTVGGARLDGITMLTGLGLDYYTIHWYDPMTASDQCLACVTYADVRDKYQIDKPIVVGEFYAAPGVGDRFTLWRTHGYAGGLAWSLLPDHTSDHFPIDFAAATAFATSLTGS